MKTEVTHKGKTIVVSQYDQPTRFSTRTRTRAEVDGIAFGSVNEARQYLNESENLLAKAKLDYCLFKVEIGTRGYWVEVDDGAYTACRIMGFDTQADMHARMRAEGRVLNAAEIATLKKMLP